MSGHKRFTRFIIMLMQIVVSVCLLGWLFLYTDLGDTKALVAATSAEIFILCTAMLAVIVVPGAIRWRWFILLFVTEVMPKPSLATVIRINSVNVALNQFLPSTIGGDLYRVLVAKSLGLPFLKGVYATLADRISALFFLLLFSAPAIVMIIVYGQITLPFSIHFIFAMCMAILCVFLICLYWFRRHSDSQRTLSFVGIFFASARTDGLVFHVILSSISIQAITLFVMAIIARSVGIEIALIPMVCILVICLLASRLPISISGWGVREGLSVSLFGLFGVAAESALVTSILYGLTEVVAALLALSVTYLTTSFKIRPLL